MISSLKGWGLLIALGAVHSPAAAQQFEFDAGREIVAGNPVEISLAGLPPDAVVEVRAERVLENAWQLGAPLGTYRSEARFQADAAGSVDLNASPSLGGSFTGVSRSGLFWSMLPVEDDTDPSPTPDVTLTATIDGQPVARSSIRLLDRMPGYTAHEVPEFPGSSFAPHPGPGAHPVVIIVDGAENAYSRDMLMPRLAAQGFSVFRFATYSLVYGSGRPAVEGLPTRYVDIPVDRLEGVRDWLARQPGVDADRIGLYGFSRNGAYALIAATRFPWVRAVAGIVPSDVVWEGWGDGVALGATSSYSWRGQPLAFVPYSESFLRESNKIALGRPFRLRTGMDEGRWANPHRVAPARIPIELYEGAVFLAGGELDNLWSSAQMVQNLAERRAEAGLATRFDIYPDAGHNLGGDGWTPTLLFETGDARAAEAAAQYRTWQGMVDFLKQSLRPGEHP